MKNQAYRFAQGQRRHAGAVAYRLLFVLAFAVGLLAMATPRLAAQKKNDYDTSKQMKVMATITRYDLMGAHMELAFDAPDDKGAVQHWTCEADNIHTDYKFTYGGDAWDKLTFRMGDKVTVVFNPSKAGPKGVGLFLQAILEGNAIFRVEKTQN